MLKFDRKFAFEYPTRLAEITASTLGATIHADGTFEAAADVELPGRRLPISDTLVIRVTAREDWRRADWAKAIQLAAGPQAVLDTRDQGYWQPTDEYEPSYRIDTGLADWTEALVDRVYGWLVDAQQYSVYIELGGVVLIIDTTEFLEYAQAVRAGWYF